MTVKKLVVVGLLSAVAGHWVWMLSTNENSIRDVVEPDRIAAQELRSKPTSAGSEQRVVPVALFAPSLTEASMGTPSVRGTIYVPAYSHIRVSSGRGRVNLATTLSIHNSSRDTPIILRHIAYHNTQGGLVQTYLQEPIGLKPFGTFEVFVPEDDLRGGSGANFIVEWASAAPAAGPVIEAVMIGTVGTTSYSFVSQGRNVSAVATNLGPH
jgi:hypothetical protein